MCDSHLILTSTWLALIWHFYFFVRVPKNSLKMRCQVDLLTPGHSPDSSVLLSRTPGSSTLQRQPSTHLYIWASNAMDVACIHDTHFIPVRVTPNFQDGKTTLEDKLPICSFMTQNLQLSVC